MKQPYVYTLPERFLKDPEVPFRWKLYTIINGFWIAGKPVFASNAFFAEKLGCSERTVREGLLDLEKMYLITRHGSSQKRRIIPGGHGDAPESERGGTQRAALGGTQRAAGVAPSVPHISDSISDSINPALASRDAAPASSSEKSEEVVRPLDERGELVSPRKKPEKALEAYKAMLAWSSERRGGLPLIGPPTKQFKAFKMAREAGISAQALQNRWIEMEGEEFFADKGFDWMNVVLSFNRKPL